MSKISGGFAFQRPLGRGGGLPGRGPCADGGPARAGGFPAGGPTRAAVRNPGGAADNTKYFPP